MPETTLAKKLTLKPGERALVVHAPDGYVESLDPLPQDVTLEAVSELAGLADVEAAAYDNAQIFFYTALVLPAGALLDRWNRKLVMIVCDGGRASSSN